jgi:hypothetical protein
MKTNIYPWIALACIGFALALAMHTFGCSGAFPGEDATVDGCIPESMQCRGTQLLYCNEFGNWDKPLDCTQYEPGDWGCCPFPEPACIPEGECDESH